MDIHYAVQPVARGIADALLIGEDFLAGDDVCLALGDNIFHSPTLPAALKRAAAQNHGRYRVWLLCRRSQTLRRGRV